jgi:hypothetical protein
MRKRYLIQNMINNRYYEYTNYYGNMEFAGGIIFARRFNSYEEAECKVDECDDDLEFLKIIKIFYNGDR